MMDEVPFAAGVFCAVVLCTEIAGKPSMQSWESPKLEEIDMSAEIGAYQPESPDPPGDEPAFVEAASFAGDG
jgi:hypothetical protein